MSVKMEISPAVRQGQVAIVVLTGPCFGGTRLGPETRTSVPSIASTKATRASPPLSEC